MRTAIIDNVLVDDMEEMLRRVELYLPSNYAVRIEGRTLVIKGEDVAGWTLDGYVIPRLASGLIFAEEVVAEPETIQVAQALYGKWEQALHRLADSSIFGRAEEKREEQETWDRLISFIEENRLDGTEYDPREDR